MTELLTWLRATVEGDKAAAEEIRASWTTTSWMVERPDGGGDERLALVDEHTRRKLVVVDWGSNRASEDELEHMARHDPQDTIARCEAELKLLDLYERYTVVPEDEQAAMFIWQANRLAEHALKALAYGYRHRPGWQEGWAP